MPRDLLTSQFAGKGYKDSDYTRVGAQVLYKQNDPYTIRVNLMYAGSSVLRVTFMYKGSILCTTDP